MMFKTHITLGFLISLLLLPYLPVKNKFFFLVLATITSSLPDIDHARSKINNQIPLFKIFSFLFRHRGIMHSIFTTLALSALAYYYINIDVAYSVLIGYTAHLLGDALTKNGIEPLYPLSRIKMRGFISTGGSLEQLCFYALLLGIVYKVATALG